MSLTVRPLHRDDIPAWYRITQEAEPWAKETVPTLAHFRAAVSRREGFALEDEAGLVGVISFSDLTPCLDAVIHATVSPTTQGRWCSRAVLRTVFGFAFTVLALERLSAYRIVGVAQDRVGGFLEAMGFQAEGVRRHALALPDGFYDVALYGLLKGDCRWV